MSTIGTMDAGCMLTRNEYLSPALRRSAIWCHPRSELESRGRMIPEEVGELWNRRDLRGCELAETFQAAEHVQGSPIPGRASRASKWRPPANTAGLSWGEYLYTSGQRATDPKRGGLYAWQQRRVLVYIEDHLDETISIATLARLARLSHSHFSRAFKRSIGLPPHRCHNTLRIEHAKKLLEHSATSLTEIGLIVGYCDASAFSRTFQQYTGETPTAYRRSKALPHRS
jgi:AraC-like DNA-binding protein